MFIFSLVIPIRPFGNNDKKGAILKKSRLIFFSLVFGRTLFQFDYLEMKLREKLGWKKNLK